MNFSLYNNTKPITLIKSFELTVSHRKIPLNFIENNAGVHNIIAMIQHYYVKVT